jgi:type II secretory pathway component PulM
MIYYAVFDGFLAALFLVFLLVFLWQTAKDRRERWGKELMKETTRRLQDTELKLDSIERTQQRMMSSLQHLEKAAGDHTLTLNHLRSHLPEPKTAG